MAKFQCHNIFSAKARSLSEFKIMLVSDAKAFAVFKKLLWGKKAACPVCGTIDRHYFRNDRKQWRHKTCTHSFSAMSGTIFANT